MGAKRDLSPRGGSYGNQTWAQYGGKGVHLFWTHWTLKPKTENEKQVIASNSNSLKFSLSINFKEMVNQFSNYWITLHSIFVWVLLKFKMKCFMFFSLSFACRRFCLLFFVLNAAWFERVLFSAINLRVRIKIMVKWVY